MAVNVSVPPAVDRLLTADVAQEIAKTFADTPVYPERIVVDTPENPSRWFPGWPGPHPDAWLHLIIDDSASGDA